MMIRRRRQYDLKRRRRRVCTRKAEGFIWFSQKMKQQSVVLFGPRHLWSGVSDPAI